MKDRTFAGIWVCSLCTLLFLTACGGDGGGDDDGFDPPAQNFAPSSLVGSTLTVVVPAENNRDIVFTDDTNWTETRDNGTINGTYSYQKNDSHTATVNLNEPGNPQTISLNFSSPTTGAAMYTAGRAGSGTFTLTQTQPDPPPIEPPPQTGNAPSSLSGKTMLATRTFTSTGPVGQTHTYTFSNNGFHDSDAPEESDGNYVYHPNGDNASLELNYTSPASFDGDKQDMQMRFDTTSSGAFTSTYNRDDGTMIQINGTFVIQQ